MIKITNTVHIIYEEQIHSLSAFKTLFKLLLLLSINIDVLVLFSFYYDLIS